MKTISQILENLKETEIPNLYESVKLSSDQKKKTIIIVIGPSGAGKDTIAVEACSNQPFEYVRTATTRKYRIEESINAHTWMREKEDNETFKEYYKNLIKEYHLIEHDQHHGNLYGLPRESLSKTLHKGTTPIIRTENHGAKALIKLLKKQYNLVVIGVYPEDEEKMKFIISHRTNSEGRIVESLKMIDEMPNICHYIIHNRWNHQQESIESFIKLVKRLTLTEK